MNINLKFDAYYWDAAARRCEATLAEARDAIKASTKEKVDLVYQVQTVTSKQHQGITCKITVIIKDDLIVAEAKNYTMHLMHLEGDIRDAVERSQEHAKKAYAELEAA